MNKTILFLLAIVLVAQANAITVFDPANFGQNWRTAVQNILQEINQLEMLKNQVQNLKSKGLFTSNPAELARRISFYTNLQKVDRELYQTLDSGNSYANSIHRDFLLSGKSPQEWQAQERRFYDRRYKTQVNRAREAAEIRQQIRTNRQARQALINQNQSAAGTVESLQINNELLAQVNDNLDVLAADVAKQNERAVTEDKALENEALETKSISERIRRLEEERRHSFENEKENQRDFLSNNKINLQRQRPQR